MLKFDNDHIITGYIKQLLKDFNLPKYPILKPGMKVFENCLYIYKDKIVKSSKNQTLNKYSSSDFKELETYIYGKKYLNITKNLELKNVVYDSYTHTYLGDYLRFYRDYNNIDLMSMYNCFTPNIVHELDYTIIDNQNTLSHITANDERYVIYAIPIKYFKEYTIAIDCDLPVELFAGLYDNKLLEDENKKDILQSLITQTYIKATNIKFKNPLLYDKVSKLNIDKYLYEKESLLKLFIKIPSSCTSSIVILEGNYLSNISHTVNGKEQIQKNLFIVDENKNVTSKFISKLQLLDINSKVSYPFSDRLIEYLFENVIHSKDKISNNIKKIQKRLSQYPLKIDVQEDEGEYKSNDILYTYNGSTYGYWNDKLTSAIQYLAHQEKLTDTCFDILGYADKDIESKLPNLNLED